jgi:hypothetical protein
MLSALERSAEMRALLVTLAIVGAAGAASAQPQDYSAPNGALRMNQPAPREPPGVRKQAEATIRQVLAEPGSAEFRAEGVSEAASVKHGAFGKRIDGPVSVVCGQYKSRDQNGGYGGYYWFFVAIKHGRVLWADVDQGADGFGLAYSDCKGAGLAS